MTKIYRNFIAAGVLLALAALIVIGMEIQTAGASNVGFMVPKLATSSTMQVGPQQVKTIAATSRNCYSRLIGSAGSPLMVSFSPTTTPTGTIGYPQAASSTVAYSNGDYGCGPIYIYAYSSTTIITSEFSQL
ncbi:hypothetical protein [Bradyrhizobium elkanii]|uniref:hypothetical protein n=1 Tax=Bradyrhizobium elkanii TaxID=29448 RepID=UPI003D24E4A9